jgi:hypothetical protein
MAMQTLRELLAWWGDLTAPATFFYAIPFIVAAGGLLAHAARRKRGE